jgi:hypothetical protein
MDDHNIKMKADKVTMRMGMKLKCLNGWLWHFKESWNITQQATNRNGATACIYHHSCGTKI